MFAPNLIDLLIKFQITLLSSASKNYLQYCAQLSTESKIFPKTIVDLIAISQLVSQRQDIRTISEYPNNIVIRATINI